jgi:hypothetical protein
MDVYDEKLGIYQAVRGSRDKDSAAECMYEYLDSIFLSEDSKLRKNQPLAKSIYVILVDEAQVLLHNEYSEEGFFFRCIRVWLRRKREEHPTVVVVFTGTTLALESYNDKSDRNLELISYLYQSLYYHSGEETFPPFLTTTTTALFSWNAADGSTQTEYERSVWYGRPLFAVMQQYLDLEPKLSTILHRLLVACRADTTSWQSQEPSWLSVLATRVQMGPTSVKMTSELVTRAYATLITADGKDAAFCSHLQDPVCARLAMGMMDEGWKYEDYDQSVAFTGKPKKWWTDKLLQLFSSGLVRPNQHNLGEVMVALYMLFCADECREGVKDDYTTFSISLSDWMENMGPPPPMSSATDKRNETNDGPSPKVPRTGEAHDPKPETANRGKVEISFIQVCNNGLPIYNLSWKALGDQAFLEHVYHAGTAFYTHRFCTMIDVVAPMRITNNNDGIGSSPPCTFGAALISIESTEEVTPREAASMCMEMRDRATQDGLKSTLCLLIVFGHQGRQAEDDEEGYVWSDMMLGQLVGGDNVAVVLRVPLEDRYNLSVSFAALTGNWDEANLLISHSFIRALSEESRVRLKETNGKVADFVDSLTKNESSEEMPVGQRALMKWG